MSVNSYLKAIYAGATAGLGALSVVLVNDTHVTGVQWVTIATATITSFGATYGVSNAAPEPKLAREPRRRRVRPPAEPKAAVQGKAAKSAPAVAPPALPAPPAPPRK